MKFIISFFLFINSLSMVAQVNDCEKNLNQDELVTVSKWTEAEYSYSDEDMDLQVEVSDGVLNLFEGKIIIETFFFHKDDNTIGIYFLADFKDGMIDKISCFLLNSNIKNLPKKIYTLYYNEPTDALLKAVVIDRK